MQMARREFLKTTAAVSAAGMLERRAPAAPGTLKKAVVVSMLPDKLPYVDRFKMCRDAGFDGIEGQTVADQKSAEEIQAAASKTGVEIHSVMNMDHWKFPLSSPKAEEVDRSVRGMETSLRNAKLWGANAVLLVPAVVNAQTPYKQAWEQSQRVIRERILPLAQELKIVVAIEEVWNKFLLSPLELSSYVDGFKSPWVQAYFDVGNVVRFGFPQDWIRTLGKRIVKVHLKDFAEKDGCAQWKNIGEGAVNWPEVRRALSEVGYEGYLTCEIEGGGLEYLKDVAQRVDRFISGQAPYQKA